MIQRNKSYLLITFFIFFTTYNFNEKKQNLSIIFPIKKITIGEKLVFNLIKLKSELEFLRNTSLFFLKEKKIIAIIDRHDFISSIQLKKKYPDTLKILILEEVPVATEIINKKKYYITKKGKKINFIKLETYKNLPIIFGKHKNFNYFYNELKENNFDIDKIKAFYYFDIGRWDLLLKNEKTIKLPKNNYQNILPQINLILGDDSFSQYKIFDYRIKSQLILQ